MRGTASSPPVGGRLQITLCRGLPFAVTGANIQPMKICAAHAQANHLPTVGGLLYFITRCTFLLFWSLFCLLCLGFWIALGAWLLSSIFSST